VLPPTAPTSPTARALVVLELVQDHPGITAERLSQRLEVSDRAIRRYVGILRDAGVPITSERGRYGGYRIGRGHRVPPLMFTTPEALALVMAVLEGNHAAGDPDDPVGSALGKIVRVLPEPVAGPVAAVRAVSSRSPDKGAVTPSTTTTAQLVQSCAAHRRLRLLYRLGRARDRTMDVDPWAVVVRHAKWYLLCWSHTADARRVLRIDRIGEITVLDDDFTPPTDLDPVRALEEHLAQGWRHHVEIEVEAPLADVERWLSRSLGRAEPIDDRRTRVVGSTDEPDWYAAQLSTSLGALDAPFRVLEPLEVRAALRVLGRRLVEAAGPD
jgi:predicted DNA-binding transcriptional regulator YafY